MGVAALRLRAFVVHLKLRAFTLYGATIIVAWGTGYWLTAQRVSGADRPDLLEAAKI
jgi:hypothetical protein